MWLFLLLAALAVLIALAVYANRRRKRALSELAASLGWTYEPNDAPEVGAGYDRWALFRIGHSGMANDVMRGDMDGRAVEVFGYRYVVGYSKRRSVYPQTVVHVVDADMALPAFSLRAADTVKQFFGAQAFGNVFLEHAPEFSMRNYVTADDPPAAGERFTDRVLAALGTQDRVAIDASGPHLFHFTPNHVAKVADIPSRVRMAVDLAEAFATRAPAPVPPPLA